MRAEVSVIPSHAVPVSVVQAAIAYVILTQECGARRDRHNAYQFMHAVRGGCEEYRFMGALGFGGKFRNNGNKAAPYVDCYPEHRTPERDAMIEAANRRLRTLFA